MTPLEDDRQLHDYIMRILQRLRLPNLAQSPPGTAEDAWRGCSELAEKYDKGMCEAYREQIDTLLVFAGLFSAIVTAFTVESYQWLSADAADASGILLAQIASSLVQNSTVLPPPTSVLSDSSATRINIYWFLSLSLSLSAALVGILAKQWIREYDRDAGRTPPEALGIRQMKFEGLEAWKVSDIVSSVPLLLQAALALFLTGIVELLWRLNIRVAVPVTVVSSLAGLFYLATTVLPSLNFIMWYFTPASLAPQCPYKSPQAWLVLRGVHGAVVSLRPRKRCQARRDSAFRDQSSTFAAKLALLRRASSWIDFDLGWASLSDVEDVARAEHRYSALAWLRSNLDHASIHAWTWHCLWDSVTPGHRSNRSESNVARVTGDLSPGEKEYLPPSSMRVASLSWLRPSFLLLVHLFKFPTRASENPILALICNMYLGESTASTSFNAFIMGWIRRVEERGMVGEVPPDLCDDLLATISLIFGTDRSHPAFGPTLLSAARLVFPRNLRDPQQAGVALGMCTLCRQWIEACADAPLNAVPLLSRINDGLTMLHYVHAAALVFEVDPGALGDGPVGLLANAISSSWPLSGRTVTLEQHISTSFETLVDVFPLWLSRVDPRMRLDGVGVDRAAAIRSTRTGELDRPSPAGETGAAATGEVSAHNAEHGSVRRFDVPVDGSSGSLSG